MRCSARANRSGDPIIMSKVLYGFIITQSPAVDKSCINAVSRAARKSDGLKCKKRRYAEKTQKLYLCSNLRINMHLRMKQFSE